MSPDPSRSPRPHAGRSLALLVVLAAVARADVLVVDPGGGQGAPLLTAALAAAQPGDIVLLRTGTYTQATPWLVDRGLTLQADAGHDVLLAPGLVTQPPAGGPAVLLRGLRCSVPPEADVLAALHVAGAAPTWAEDCTFTGRAGFVHPVTQLALPPTPGVITGALPQAVLVRCVATGGAGLTGQVGAAGVMTQGRALLQDCTCTGGDGGAGAGLPPFFLDGGPGLLALFGQVFVDGGTCVGGAETDALGAQAASGPGLHVALAAATAREAAFIPGTAVPPGVPGAAVALEAFGAFSETLAPLPRAVAPSPVREGQMASLLFLGPAGSALLALLGAEPSVVPLPAKGGNSLVGAPSLVLYVGPSPGPGVPLTLDVTLPLLPPGVAGVRLFLQAWAAPAGGGAWAGTGTSMSWLDAAY
jgi:hypothetical protein